MGKLWHQFLTSLFSNTLKMCAWLKYWFSLNQNAHSVSKGIQNNVRTRHVKNLILCLKNKYSYVFREMQYSFSINNSFWVAIVIMQLSLISFIFPVTKASQVERFGMCLTVPRLPEGRW